MEAFEIAELDRAEFWESAAPRVMWNEEGGDGAGRVGAFLDKCGADAGHLVFRTSGTQGRAKYVCVSRAAVLASAAAVNRHLGVNSLDHWLRALPVFHVGGVGVHARAYLSGCELTVQGGRWDPEEFTRLCREKGATLSALVPAQVYDLVAAGQRAPKSLRAVVVGGGSLGEKTGNRAWELGWPLLQSYGLSEGSSQVATAGLDSLERGRFENGGLPVLDHWEARVAENGCLEIKGEALFSGYLREESGEMVLDSPVREGWFLTSDRIRLDDGLLNFLGREGDVVKILGELVSLRNLRTRLEECAGGCGLGNKVALAVLPDDRLGNRLVLAHAAGAGAGTLAGLRRRFDEGLHGYERISEIAEVKEIPGSEIGKIDYGRLNAVISKAKEGT